LDHSLLSNSNIVFIWHTKKELRRRRRRKERKRAWKPAFSPQTPSPRPWNLSLQSKLEFSHIPREVLMHFRAKELLSPLP